MELMLAQRISVIKSYTKSHENLEVWFSCWQLATHKWMDRQSWSPYNALYFTSQTVLFIRCMYFQKFKTHHTRRTTKY